MEVKKVAEIRLAVRQLVEFLLRSGDIDSRFAGFDRALEGARIHRRLQKQGGEGYAAEVFLSGSRSLDGLTFIVEGRADGILTREDGSVLIDEIKTTTRPCAEITADANPCHWAQGMVYGALYAQQQGLDQLDVQLTYFQMDEERIFRFVRHFSQAELEQALLDLLRQYAPWAARQQAWQARRDASCAQLAFPYPAYRPGQRALAGEIYRACRTGREQGRKGGSRLFCQAPTGTGKTMSALFPALHAMGEGHGQKIFYLTARTTAQTAAQQALEQLRKASPELALRSLTLAAKDKACLCKGPEGRPVCLPEVCPYAKGYYDRVKDALDGLLDTGSLDRDTLAQAGRQYQVCPFELGLDLSEWCDVVIGDYNYLFDPTVHLRRFFDSAGDWLFLIDEAHNLPDRARAMYSARFCKSSLMEAKRALGPGRSGLKTALGRADKAFLAARREAEHLAPRRKKAEAPAPDDAPVQTVLFETEPAPPAEKMLPEQPLYAQDGVLFFEQLPTALLHPLQHLVPPLQDWLEANPDSPGHPQLLDLLFEAQDVLRAAERFDSHFAAQLTVFGSELVLELLCLDPAPFVDASLACGRAAALFSATFSPPGYYREVLGCPEARAVALPSPFPPENLGLYCLPISTRYRDREASIRPVSDALAAMTQGRAGNYLAFFPSYTYLRQVYEDFTLRYPQIPTLAQESGLDDAGREAFLARFSPQPGAVLLGFGVLGGIFGEGVDLTGERLIGCAVVGVGLPQVSPRQEMLRRYYDQNAQAGFDYAYRCPGMNKVLQAAGRVIRTPEDKGVVLLIDDRFAQADYRRLLPAHWAHLRYLQNLSQLEKALDTFWHAPC